MWSGHRKLAIGDWEAIGDCWRRGGAIACGRGTGNWRSGGGRGTAAVTFSSLPIIGGCRAPTGGNLMHPKLMRSDLFFDINGRGTASINYDINSKDIYRRAPVRSSRSVG